MAARSWRVAGPRDATALPSRPPVDRRCGAGLALRPLKGTIAVSVAMAAETRLTSGPLAMTLGRRSDASPEVSFLVTVARRKARSAVMRNRIRRLLREALRASIREHEVLYREVGLTTVVAVWRSAPPATMLLRLHHVQPHVDTILRRALDVWQRPNDETTSRP